MDETLKFTLGRDTRNNEAELKSWEAKGFALSPACKQWAVKLKDFQLSKKHDYICILKNGGKVYV